MIGTHASNYHCDDVTGTVILRYTKEYQHHKVLRSLDMNELNKCDLVFDIGGIYDHSQKKYDHHQRGYFETFSPNHTIKLCGCGLLYKHYGNEIIRNAIESLHLEPLSEDQIEVLKYLLYDNFFAAIDADDNGIDCSPNEILFRDQTTLGNRIRRLNARKEPFEKAQQLAEEAFLDILQNCYEIIKTQFPIVNQSYLSRFDVHSSGKIIVETTGISCRECIDLVEKMNGKEEEILFIVQPDKARNQWKSTALSKKNSFVPLKKFPEEWRGLRDEQLSKVSGVDDAVFVHSSGFLCCHKTFEGIMKMTIMALE